MSAYHALLLATALAANYDDDWCLRVEAGPETPMPPILAEPKDDDAWAVRCALQIVIGVHTDVCKLTPEGRVCPCDASDRKDRAMTQHQARDALERREELAMVLPFPANEDVRLRLGSMMSGKYDRAKPTKEVELRTWRRVRKEIDDTRLSLRARSWRIQFLIPYPGQTPEDPLSLNGGFAALPVAERRYLILKAGELRASDSLAVLGQHPEWTPEPELRALAMEQFRAVLKLPHWLRGDYCDIPRGKLMPGEVDPGPVRGKTTPPKAPAGGASRPGP